MRDIGPEYREKVLRGRPKKKPEYDREQEISDLVRQVVELYAIPYDDRDERPPDAPSINWIAQTLNISRLKVRKLLIAVCCNRFLQVYKLYMFFLYIPLYTLIELFF